MDGRITGLGLQFYRGIGPVTQFVGPFSQFNFFAGANNAGKSILLNFISEHLPRNGQRNDWANPPQESANEFRGTESGKAQLHLAIAEEELVKRLNKHITTQRRFPTPPEWTPELVNQLSHDGLVWLHMLQNGAPSGFSVKHTTKEWMQILDRNGWYRVWSTLTGKSNGDLVEHWIPDTLNTLLSLCRPTVASTVLIPAIREIGPSGVKMSDFSGTGLIDRLAEIQSPDHHSRHEKATFDRINDFLQYVTGKEGAQIEVPYNLKHVLVHIDGKVLPLASLGTGIHEVVMIAAFCLLNESSIICIEEPEIHLHPVLQRKLVKYLKENTDSQYFIATHSPALIDMPGASVFHVRNDGVQSYINPVLLRSDKRQLTDELGYKASDIIQANAVVWVEGPSDQIYIRHWLKAVAPELVEGIDFSIMFYGGRLLSHLSADPEELEEFINLRSLNQNSAIVMDSDRTSARVKINETKERLKAEFSDGGLCWITKGREIENYIDHKTLQDAVQAVHTHIYDHPLEGGAYDHALYFQRKQPRTGKTTMDENKPDLEYKKADKVAVARLVTESEANLDLLDLNDRITELAEFLRKASL